MFWERIPDARPIAIVPRPVAFASAPSAIALDGAFLELEEFATALLPMAMVFPA